MVSATASSVRALAQGPEPLRPLTRPVSASKRRQKQSRPMPVMQGSVMLIAAAVVTAASACPRSSSSTSVSREVGHSSTRRRCRVSAPAGPRARGGGTRAAARSAWPGGGARARRANVGCAVLKDHEGRHRLLLRLVRLGSQVPRHERLSLSLSPSPAIYIMVRKHSGPLSSMLSMFHFLFTNVKVYVHLVNNVLYL